MEDNYNYYTSTHHSTPLRTYYVALNRLGGPRKTHLPANKSLGKLSTYVKSFTLTVPEHRSEAIIARLFGSNHVKHGMKHLCDSGKELMPLTTANLLIPKNCTNIVSIVKMKTKSGQHSHKNQQHNQSGNGAPPAALTERHHKRHHSGKQQNCTHEACTSKKKTTRNDSGNNDKSNVTGALDLQEATKNKQKQKKNQKKNQKNNRNRNGIKNVSDGVSSTTTETTMAVRTTSAKSQTDLNSIMAASSDDDVRQILDDPSGQSAFGDDDDYNYDS